MNTLYELTSRYTAAAMQVKSQDCNFYISQAVTDQAKLTKICTDFNFRNLTDLKNFVRPFYYNNDPTSRASLKNKTAMTDAELNSLYDATNPTSFGSLINA